LSKSVSSVETVADVKYARVSTAAISSASESKRKGHKEKRKEEM
jgi:hypothetical protein